MVLFLFAKKLTLSPLICNIYRRVFTQFWVKLFNISLKSVSLSGEVGDKRCTNPNSKKKNKVKGNFIRRLRGLHGFLFAWL